MTRTKYGPQPLTIAAYKERQQRRKTTKEPEIPETIRPKKRRGGYTAIRRQKKAVLLRIINSDPPPSWETSRRLWRKIDKLEEEIDEFLSIKKGTATEAATTNE